MYDEQLVSRFEWLRGRPKDEVSTPRMFMAFDCLQLDEGDLRSQSLRVRRERLDYVLDGAPAIILPVRRLADHGLKAWQEVVECGYEGLVAKDPAIALRGRARALVAEGEAEGVPCTGARMEPGRRPRPELAVAWRYRVYGRPPGMGRPLVTALAGSSPGAV